MERETIRRIHEAVRTGRLPKEFKAKQVNNALGITWAGTFLAKHCVGNPGKNTEHFIRTDRGQYRLKEDERGNEWGFGSHLEGVSALKPMPQALPRREASSREIYWLATLDSANAAVRWPQKHVRTAANRRRNDNKEIATLLKLELLWRRPVAVTLPDLFNNLALAKFIRDHKYDCMRLADAELLQGSSWIAGDLHSGLDDWVFGRGPGQPMHWHHLSTDRQTNIDEASRRGLVSDLNSLASYLYLEEHDLSLEEMVRLYDSIFPARKIVVVRAAESSLQRLFPKRVEMKWVESLRKREQLGPPTTAATILVEKALEKCWLAKGRRRLFYTTLEELPSVTPYSSEAELTALKGEVTDAQCFVVNDAYYDEYEECSHFENGMPVEGSTILTSRDITNVWLPEEIIQPNPSVTAEQDRIISKAFAPIELITFEDVVEFHQGSADEYKEFQASINRLHSLHSRGRTEEVSETEIREAAKKHIEILHDCVQGRLKQRHAINWTEGTVAEVFVGTETSKLHWRGELATDALAHDLGRSMLSQTAIGWIASGLLNFVLHRKTPSYHWKQFAASFGGHVRQRLSEK